MAYQMLDAWSFMNKYSEMDSTRFGIKFREGMAFSLSSQIKLNLRATRMPFVWKYLLSIFIWIKIFLKSLFHTPMTGQVLIFIPQGGDARELVCSFQVLGGDTKAIFLWRKTEISIPIQKPLFQAAEGSPTFAGACRRSKPRKTDLELK